MAKKESITTKSSYEFTVLFEPAIEGGYIVTCPALPEIITQGDSLAEARRLAKDAIELVLTVMHDEGRSFPKDATIKLNPVKEKVKVALPSL